MVVIFMTIATNKNIRFSISNLINEVTNTTLLTKEPLLSNRDTKYLSFWWPLVDYQSASKQHLLQHDMFQYCANQTSEVSGGTTMIRSSWINVLISRAQVEIESKIVSAKNRLRCLVIRSPPCIAVDKFIVSVLQIITNIVDETEANIYHQTSP